MALKRRVQTTQDLKGTNAEESPSFPLAEIAKTYRRCMQKPNSMRSVPGLGERVVALRDARSLSQQVLATRAGISIPRLAHVERYGAATTETLVRVAKALGVSVDDLTGRGVAP